MECQVASPAKRSGSLGDDLRGGGDVDHDSEAAHGIAETCGHIAADFGVGFVKEKPFGRGAVGRAVVGQEIGGEVRVGVNAESENGVAEGAEVIGDALGEVEGESLCDQRFCGGHVGDHGAVGEDAGAGELEGGNGDARFLGGAACGDGHVDSGGAGSCNCLGVARVNRLALAEEGTIEIDCDKPPRTHHVSSCRGIKDW